MRPAPPRGAVFEQFRLVCAAFHDASAPAVLWLGPMPSECPTCPISVAAADVQSAQVNPGARVPSAFDPVRMSCSLGPGDPVHCPLMRRPFSSTKTEASPERLCNSVRLLATTTPLALNHGPRPMRSRALVGRLPFDGSRSTLKYARQTRPV